jgi:signal transduction histidine kinase
VGIETEKERELFSAYETTSSGEAHGLGLYICKTHMESMNGRITCIRGDGTLSFVVTMPAMLG